MTKVLKSLKNKKVKIPLEERIRRVDRYTHLVKDEHYSPVEAQEILKQENKHKDIDVPKIKNGRLLEPLLEFEDNLESYEL